MAKRIGDVQQVQITLPNSFVGKFIRVRVKLDVNKKAYSFCELLERREDRILSSQV